MNARVLISSTRIRENSMKPKGDEKTPTPEAQLQSFIDRFGPKDQKVFRAVRAALRKSIPTANELGYDYTSHVVIAFSATVNAIDAFLAIALRADGVRLYLMGAPKLPDPKKLLMGSGGQARYVGLESASRLAHPDLKALLEATLAQTKAPLPAKGKGALVLR